ncbi:MAG: tyrosine-type recombinase/integrase [Planctomycetota bacterium]
MELVGVLHWGHGFRDDPLEVLTADMHRLLAVAKARSKRDHAVFLLAYRHGLRASEIGLLRREHVDFAANRIRSERLKNSLGRDHPLEPDEAQAIRSYLRTREDSLPCRFMSRNRRPLSRYSLDKLMKRCGVLAKIPGDRHHFHGLKHSIAVHLAAAGLDVLVIRDWLGHKRIQNTMAYTRLLSTRGDAEVGRAVRSQHVA